jgi:hypothetical protein
MQLTLVCPEDNDLYRVLADNAIACARFANAREAVDAAPDRAGVMILPSSYPTTPTAVYAALYEKAAQKNLRLYVEFPAALPEQGSRSPRGIQWERGVVASDAFAPELERLRILALHGCRFIPVQTQNPHLVMARVAGFDTAVFGLPPETFPILYEHPRGNLLVATTKLSQFVTARYAPTDAWRIIWRWILRWVTQAPEFPALEWTPTVRPSYQSSERLPADVEVNAFRRGVAWFKNADLFVRPRQREGRDRRAACRATDARENERTGDGSRGVMEGISATIHPDGCQDRARGLRSDCIGEVSMAMAFSGALSGPAEDKAIAANLSDYIYFTSEMAQGPRADPASPTYGLICWGLGDSNGGIYYGDDNARCLLGTMAAAALLQSDRWDEGLLKCMLANLRTTGPQGFRSDRLEDYPIQEKGWSHYFTAPRTNYAPHYESWLWACLLWAYGRTGFRPFLERPRTAIGMTMEAYPDQWRWTNGIQQERARMLLPLSWLVRVEDTQQHRQWLRFMAQELLDRQDPCGAIREEVGAAGKGSYGPCESNEDYGTTEAPLIQANGDPVCDMLYTTNFAFVGLHEAAAATGESIYADAEERLARFLCRIQVRSESHPELDGGWFRAFDFRRWEYWASSADLGWGAWSIESGWTQAWIVSVLAMRRMKTSLWELTAGSAIRRYLDPLAALMLPEHA